MLNPPYAYAIDELHKWPNTFALCNVVGYECINHIDVIVKRWFHNKYNDCLSLYYPFMIQDYYIKTNRIRNV